MRLFTALIFLFSSLFSIDPSTPDEVANLSAQPSSIVGGYVNVITGDFVYRRSDLTIHGAAPLTLDRFFSSREKKYYGWKWEIFNHHRATKKDNRLYIQEASGMTIPYTKVKKGHYKPDESFFAQGIPIHSLHNPKLNQATYDGKKLTVFQSDGTMRVFRPYWFCERKYAGKSIEFVLERETHQDGHVSHYNWKCEKSIFPDQAYSLRREHFLQLRRVYITSPDGKTQYCSANYTYSGSKVLAQGSNGKTLTYKTSSRDKSTIGFIDHVTSSDHPRCTHKWDNEKLKKFMLPDERKILLSYDGDHISKLELPEGLTYTFEYYRGWTNVVHPDRSKSTYYHSKHHIDKIVHYGHEMSPVRIETFDWTEEGKLARKEIRDRDQNSLFLVEYEYDKNLNLICQKTTGAISTRAPTTITTEYEYDSLHRLTKEIQSTGHTLQYQYLNNTHLPTERLEAKSGVIIKRTTYVYDKDHLLVSEIIDDEGLSPVSYRRDIIRLSDGPHIGMPYWIDHFTNGHLTSKDHYIYNKYNNVKTHEVYGADGEYSHKTVHIYDDKGLLKKHIDPMGHTTRYKYNHNRELIKETRPNGLYIKRAYDKLGRLESEQSIGKAETQETRYKYHKNIQPSWIIDYLGDKIHNEYDYLGNLIKTTLPNGGITTFTYNALGHIISKTDPLGNTTKIKTNLLGEPLEVHHPDGSAETYAYTLEGKLKTHINQNKITTQFSHDEYGNVIEESLFDASGIPICKRQKTYNAFQLLTEIDTEGYTTAYTYNPRNQLAEKTREGHAITYTYTPLGRLKTQTHGDATKFYGYDLLGNTILEEESSRGETLTRIKTTYNASGSPITVTRYPNNTPATSILTYDAFNRPIRKTDALGNTTTFHYTGHTTTTHFPGGIQIIETQNPGGKPVLYQKFASSRLIDEKSYKYDKAFNLILEKTGNHTLACTYDSMGRKETMTESGNRKTTYSYTPTGQIATLKKPDKTLLQYTYDPLGNLTTLTSSSGDIDYSYEHNTFGQLIASQDNLRGSKTKRILNPDGNILEETQASGHTIRYTYTSNGLRSTMTLPTSEEVTYTHKGTYIHTISCKGRTHTFEHDLAGNPTCETTLIGRAIHRTYDLLNRPESLHSDYLSQACTYTSRGNISSILQDGLTKTYDYDGQDRLTLEPDHHYVYDMLHNRIKHNEATYAHNTLSENFDYVYDQNGNLIDDGETTYEYDSLARLIRMGNQTFTYDAEHRRTDLLWDHDREMGTLDQLRILDPTHPAEYAIAILTPSEILLPVHDLHHNLIKVFSLQGELLEAHILTAFGELSKPSTIPWSFCSKRATGKLLYFGRRYYHPADGRFISPDPLGYIETANLYTYALNNPLIYFDPKGLQPDFISSPLETRRYEHLFRPPAVDILNQLSAFCYDHNLTRSESFQVGSFDLPNGAIGFINGIANTKEESMEKARYLSQYAGGANIYGVYNASNGLIGDVIDCGLGRAGIMTPPTQKIKDNWHQFFARTIPEAKFFQPCYSGGATHVKNALLTSPREIRQRIIVLAIAPSEIVSKTLCYESYNYMSRRDFVTHLDIVGKMRHRNELIILEPHPNANFFDHDFLSPTFAEPINRHIKEYIEYYGGMQ